MVQTAADWFRLMLGLFVVFGLFHHSAAALGSDRGERGLLVCALVVAATAAADRLLIGRRHGATLRHLGLGRPSASAVVAAIGLALLLVLVPVLFLRAREIGVTFYPGWLSLLPGLFAQGGIAEEVLFRGFLFGHVRQGRTFWRAAVVSMVPFVIVHLLLFFSMSWPIALASVLLAIVVSFPMAHLYELGHNTIWGPAILHFVIQSTVKVLAFPHGAEPFALVWMAASAMVPLLVFAVKAPALSAGR